MRSWERRCCWHPFCLPVVVPISEWRTVRAATSMKVGLSLWRWMAAFHCGHPWKDNSAWCSLTSSTVTPWAAAVDPDDWQKPRELPNDWNHTRPGPHFIFSSLDWGLSWLQRLSWDLVYLKLLELVVEDCWIQLCEPLLSWSNVVETMKMFVLVKGNLRGQMLDDQSD